MEQHQNSLLNIIHEERSRCSLDSAELQDYLYHTSPGPPLPPPSPDSPWTCSPHQTPSPSLLYHCIASLRRHDGTIHSIAASPASGLVFTGSDSRHVRAWQAPDCSERGLLKAKSGEVRAILAHAGTLFTSHKDNKVRTWTFNSGTSSSSSFKKLSSIPRTNPFSLFPNTKRRLHHRVTCMAYHHADEILYTGSTDGTVRVWRVSSGKRVDSFAAHETRVTAALVNQHDGSLFTCSADGSIKIWRRIYREDSHTLTMILRFQDSPVNAVALTSSAAFLYSGSGDGTISFWERERGTLTSSSSSSQRFSHGGFMQGHRFSVLCVVAVEKMVFSGSEDTTIRIWRREEGGCMHECLAVMDGHRGPVRCLAASLEVERGVFMVGFLVYSASLDQTFKVWRVKVLPDEVEDRIAVAAEVGIGGASPVLSPSWVRRKRRATYF